MSAADENRPQARSSSPIDREGGEASAGSATLTWADAAGRIWRIVLSPQRIVLQSGDDLVELPADNWRRDILIALHGRGFIIRFETFEHTVGFALTPYQAAPLLAHLGISVPSCGGDREPMAGAEEEPARRRLLWPKVSPLAVWALICSAIVFVPVLGLLPAIATVILLVLHRIKVRRPAAMRHSRVMCGVAFVLLVIGLAVSGLTLLGLREYGHVGANSSLFAESAPAEKNWGLIVAAILVVLVSLTVHEAGHAITAWWLGDGYARSLGRVTLNPLAHIDPFGTVILPLILAFAGGPVFGYARPVPVQVASLPRYRRAHILISIAGPGSNLLLAAASLTLLLGVSCSLRLAVPEATLTNLASLDRGAMVTASGFAFAAAFGTLCTILKLSFVINVLLALFNLIPIPPLDGSWVLEHLFPMSLGRLYAGVRPYGFLIFLGAIYTGLFDYLAYPVFAVLGPALVLLAAATGT